MLHGIAGQPYVDLAPALAPHGVSLDVLPALDAEIMAALPKATTTYTGGTLKWMGVAAPWTLDDGHDDAMHVVQALDDDDWSAFVALGADPSLQVAGRAQHTFGDETDHPFTRAQERFLQARGAYFPWKTCFHFVENRRWEDNHDGRGKGFTDEALALFPQTTAFIRALPFTTIGRAVLFGLQPGDHATAHRDSEPGRALSIAQSISFAPRPGKRLYVRADDGEEVVIGARAYWFNDMDWHGVHADDAFRYSIRVDGVFRRDFARALTR